MDGEVAKTAEQLGEEQRAISVAEFFEKNRHLLGFDNPTKALLTVVKEAVDNSLDACEEAQILPEIEVEIEEMDDGNYKISVEDNGPGIVREQIPRIFAKLLYGSKFGRGKQQRGQQGIGISAAVLYGQLTTGRPTIIYSRTDEDKPTKRMEIKIDTVENEPDIIEEEEAGDELDHTGTRIVLEVEGRYVQSEHSVDEYIRQTSIMNPHATMRYTNPYGEEFVSERATETLPDQPKEIKPHPHGIELGILERMAGATSSRTVSSFLQNDFTRVGATTAEEICRLADVDKQTTPAEMTHSQLKELYSAIQQAQIMRPPTDCLAPMGSELLEQGIKRGMKPDFVKAVTRDPAVYRGNPFQIEAVVAYGGDLAKDEEGEELSEDAKNNKKSELLRYANKMPLLYKQSACAVTKAVRSIGWRRYGLSQPGGGMPQGPVIIAVHICSTWVPYTSESKEAIASYDEIVKEVKLALQECGRALKRHLSSIERRKKKQKRRRLFKIYIPELVEDLSDLTGEDKDELEAGLNKFVEENIDLEEEDEDDKE